MRMPLVVMFNGVFTIALCVYLKNTKKKWSEADTRQSPCKERSCAERASFFVQGLFGFTYTIFRTPRARSPLQTGAYWRIPRHQGISTDLVGRPTGIPCWSRYSFATRGAPASLGSVSAIRATQDRWRDPPSPLL